MITFFARHGVTDYEAWKKKIDAIPNEAFVEFKIVGTTVYRGVNGSEAIVLHTFNTWEDAEAHKERMESQPQEHFEKQNAIPPITIWIAEEV